VATAWPVGLAARPKAAATGAPAAEQPGPGRGDRVAGLRPRSVLRRANATARG
jgi:hypothetical protein